MILITMAGASSRFSRAGYDVPKYELPLWGRTVFDYSLLSFINLFETDHFLFVALKQNNSKKFIKKTCESLGIRNYSIFEINQITRGQAETAYLPLKKSFSGEHLYIFNIDTILYDFNKKSYESDGWLEVFIGTGDHWSFVKPGENFEVLKTTEKIRISDLCSNGLYYFKSSQLFCDIFEEALRKNDLSLKELYVAPLYNIMISRGLKVNYSIIDLKNIDFCGTPDEYRFLLNRGPIK